VVFCRLMIAGGSPLCRYRGVRVRVSDPDQRCAEHQNHAKPKRYPGVRRPPRHRSRWVSAATAADSSEWPNCVSAAASVRPRRAGAALQRQTASFRYSAIRNERPPRSSRAREGQHRVSSRRSRGPSSCRVPCDRRARIVRKRELQAVGPTTVAVLLPRMLLTACRISCRSGVEPRYARPR
jgi:hypothetical protein